MGERSATKPAQRQYGKLAARHLPMLRLELPDSRVSQSHQRRLGNPCIIDRYGQWVASSFNDLHPQREATIAHRSEEHTSELQSLMRISYAVFCLKKKNTTHKTQKTLTYTRQTNYITHHTPN